MVFSAFVIIFLFLKWWGQVPILRSMQYVAFKYGDFQKAIISLREPSISINSIHWTICLKIHLWKNKNEWCWATNGAAMNGVGLHSWECQRPVRDNEWCGASYLFFSKYFEKISKDPSFCDQLTECINMETKNMEKSMFKFIFRR